MIGKLAALNLKDTLHAVELLRNGDLPRVENYVCFMHPDNWESLKEMDAAHVFLSDYRLDYRQWSEAKEWSNRMVDLGRIPHNRQWRSAYGWACERAHIIPASSPLSDVRHW